MNTYEIINPSDEAYLDAPSHAVADFCVIMVGSGTYAARWGGHCTPLFAFGGDPVAYFRDTHGVPDIAAFMRERRAEITAACKSARLVRERSSAIDLVSAFHDFPEQLPE